jgi:hypothetical protein
MLETNGTQEIAVHHAGTRVASLLFYNTNNYISIGRDMGWGVSNVAIDGTLQMGQQKKIQWANVAVDSTSGIIWSDGNTDYSITRTAGAWNAPDYQQLQFRWITGFIFTCGGNTYGKSFVDFQCRTKVSNGNNSYTTYGPNATYGASLQVGSSNANLVNSTTSQVLCSNGNLHLDCGTGKDLYLNYHSPNRPIVLAGQLAGYDTRYHNMGRTSSTNGQAIICDFNNFDGSWIGVTAGSTLTGDRVVIGGLNTNGATIGAHNFNLTAWATLSIANPSFFYPSDENLKENVITANYNLCYDNIKKIRVARYNYKADGPTRSLNKKDNTVLGIIAQELQTIFPKSIGELEDYESKETFLTVNHEQLNFCTLGAVKHLQDIVEEQQKQIKEQDEKIKMLSNHLTEMTLQINKLTEKLFSQDKSNGK